MWLGKIILIILLQKLFVIEKMYGKPTQCYILMEQPYGKQKTRVLLTYIFSTFHTPTRLRSLVIICFSK